MLPDILYEVPIEAPATGSEKPVEAEGAAGEVSAALDVVAGFSAAGFSAADCPEDWEAPEPVEAAALPPSASLRPGWMSDGSLPTAARLSEYSFFQPPSTSCVSAIFERESP